MRRFAITWAVTVKSAKGGQIAVLPATCSGATTLYFPYAAAEQTSWSSLSLLNVGDGEAAITSIAQDAAGNLRFDQRSSAL